MHTELQPHLIYFAGLFDGEGSVDFKRRIERRKRKNGLEGYSYSKSMRIRMEISMTDQDTIQWCCDNFGGILRLKPRKIHKLQYRWKAVFRNAYKIAKEIIPYSITKKEALQKIIDYYEKGVE